MVRAGCVFAAGIHPSRTWTSGSFESVWWNAWVHRLDLGLYSHPKEFLGEWSLNPCSLQGENPLYRKSSPDGDRTCDAVDSEPKHYQQAIPAPPGHLILCVGDSSRCCEIVKNLELCLSMRLLLLLLKSRNDCPTQFMDRITDVWMIYTGQGVETNEGFLTRMVYLYYISCLRYTIVAGNPWIYRSMVVMPFDNVEETGCQLHTRWGDAVQRMVTWSQVNTVCV